MHRSQMEPAHDATQWTNILSMGESEQRDEPVMREVRVVVVCGVRAVDGDETDSVSLWSAHTSMWKKSIW